MRTTQVEIQVIDTDGKEGMARQLDVLAISNLGSLGIPMPTPKYQELQASSHYLRMQDHIFIYQCILRIQGISL